MRQPTPSSGLDVAFHEWEAVVAALAAGDQPILIRKGGIHEPGGRFRLEHDRFLLYPTFTHQQASDLRPALSGKVVMAPPSGSVTLTHWAEVIDAFKAPPVGCIDPWLSFHIYTRDLIARRLAYKPHLALHLLLVRVYRLADPVTLPEPEGHHACVSWVELPEPVSTEHSVPVLDDGAFADKSKALREALTACNLAARMKE